MDWSTTRPRLIILETARPGEEDRGSELAELLRSQGYRSIKTLGCNDVYESAGS
jgi:hypothetical protein